MYYIRSTDGTKIAVYDYNPQGKQTVFFIHGWPLSHQIFEYQISLLTDCGCRVHVPTYIIHGDKDVVVSKELAEIQHKCICSSKLITLPDSGHGIMYDQLEKFNAIFMDSSFAFTNDRFRSSFP